MHASVQALETRARGLERAYVMFLDARAVMNAHTGEGDLHTIQAFAARQVGER